MSTCKHQIDNPWGNPCYICDLISRIEKLEKNESLVSTLNLGFIQNFNRIFERLEKLETDNQSLLKSILKLRIDHDKHELIRTRNLELRVEKLEQKESAS